MARLDARTANPGASAWRHGVADARSPDKPVTVVLRAVAVVSVLVSVQPGSLEFGEPSTAVRPAPMHLLGLGRPGGHWPRNA